MDWQRHGQLGRAQLAADEFPRERGRHGNDIAVKKARRARKLTAIDEDGRISVDQHPS